MRRLYQVSFVSACANFSSSRTEKFFSALLCVVMNSASSAMPVFSSAEMASTGMSGQASFKKATSRSTSAASIVSILFKTTRSASSSWSFIK